MGNENRMNGDSGFGGAVILKGTFSRMHPITTIVRDTKKATVKDYNHLVVRNDVIMKVNQLMESLRNGCTIIGRIKRIESFNPQISWKSKNRV